MKLRRLFVSAFASALAFGVSSVGTNAAPFDPIGSLEVTGTFGTTGQTLSGTLAFSGFLVSGANISISGVSGVFDVVLGQDGFKDTPTVINPNPPQEWVVAIRDSSNNFRMGMFFTILDLGPNPTFITQILGPIVDGNYINPPVDCLPACTTHSADSLTGGFSLGRFLGKAKRAQPLGLDALRVAGGLVFGHSGRALAGLGFFLVERGLCTFHVFCVFRNTHEHPVVEPHVSHFMQVPLRTSVKFPHSPQASPS